MAIYCITAYSGTTERRYEVRHRIDAAKLLLKKWLYEELRSRALLDRPIAHRMMGQVDLFSPATGHCLESIELGCMR